MITGGVDLAADPKRTALCAIDWASGSVELSDGPVDDDAIVTLAHRASLSGWDVPLGWPDAFVAAISEHHQGPEAGRGVATADPEARRLMRYRLTDRCFADGSDQHRIGTQRQRLDDVQPAADTTVYEHRQIRPNGLGNTRQHAGRRRRLIELTPAMIGNDDAFDPVVRGHPGVLDIQDALENKFARPVLANPRNVVPRHRRVELFIDPLTEVRRTGGTRYRLSQIAKSQWFPTEPNL